MKPYGIVKTILYLFGGVIVLVLNEFIMEREYVGVVVGLVVLSYAADIVIFCAINRSMPTANEFYIILTHALLGVVLFLVKDDIVSVCLVWAVWTIIRECKEFAENIGGFINRWTACVNVLESAVITVFAFMMILSPTKEHAHLHIIILGIELMLEVIFPLMSEMSDRFASKRSENKALPVEVQGGATEVAAVGDPIEAAMTEAAMTEAAEEEAPNKY